MPRLVTYAEAERLRREGHVQPPGSALEASEVVGGSTPSISPIGAYTGLDLPKAVLKRRNVREVVREVDEGDAGGPDVQPMRDGLPNTPIEACRELMLAIVAQGMVDHDVAYVMTPTFIHHLLYVGLDPDAALQVKIAFLLGKVNAEMLRPERLRVARRVAD